MNSGSVGDHYPKVLRSHCGDQEAETEGFEEFADICAPDLLTSVQFPPVA